MARRSCLQIYGKLILQIRAFFHLNQKFCMLFCKEGWGGGGGGGGGVTGTPGPPS